MNYIDKNGCFLDDIVDFYKDYYALLPRAEIAATAYNFLVKYKGYRLAYDLFYYGLFGDGKSATYGQKSLMAVRLMSNSKMKNRIKNYINKAKKQNKTKFKYENVDIVFISGDLYYAVQKVSYDIWGTKCSNGKWKVSVKMVDIYNFDEWRNPFSGLGNNANNFGRAIQAMTIIEPFSWIVIYYQYF